ncbi:MAG: RNA methyltransferase [Bacteroidales bacterium]|jgi:TrmH family RNA methyltransferase|nr:RNA methyltransferase [Bacteroidales bacterium]
MVSKNIVKLIKSLSLKKYREKEGLFLVEGNKMVTEALCSNYKVAKIIATHEFLLTTKTDTSYAVEIIEASQEEIRKASLLKNPQNSMALCEIPENENIPENINNGLTLYLDGIQDPGNLGTIIRTCDWFNIGFILCSPDTADIYSPKVVQASMGSIFRTKLFYIPAWQVLKKESFKNVHIFGAFPDGNNIYTEYLPENTIMFVGNEGNGIRKEVEPFINKRIMIPCFKNNGSAESLNVAVAAGIICSEFKRRFSYDSYSK